MVLDRHFWVYDLYTKRIHTLELKVCTNRNKQTQQTPTARNRVLNQLKNLTLNKTLNLALAASCP